MKDRQKKKVETHRREAIHRLLDLVLDINGLEERKQEITGNLPTAFFEFCGHTCKVAVDVCSSGWAAGVSPDIRVSAYLDKGEEIKRAVRLLEGIKAETPAAGTAGESR